ncbi:MAG: protein kinase [Proteobacteria bacterium]|nr:protein kinase [Pseudomonadota bacterium]MBQ4360889.1 protein kinase [Pseudomonadota bacterium]
MYYVPSVGDTLLNRYNIEEILSESDHASVVKCMDTRLDVYCALKILIGETEAPDWNDRKAAFMRAYRTQAQLNHPNIVHVSNIESRDGVTFGVMELLQGPTLEQYLHNDSLGPKEILELFLSIADAVSMAHTSSIIHRSLSPVNIILHQQGARLSPRILNFSVERDLEKLDPVWDLPYMSPEQLIAFDDSSEASDVFALCMMMHNAFAHCVPVEFETLQGYIDYYISSDGAEPLAELIPADFVPIIQRGIRSNPSERYENATELLKALKALSSGFKLSANLTIEAPKQYPTVTPSSPVISQRKNPSSLDNPIIGNTGDIKLVPSTTPSSPIHVHKRPSSIGVDVSSVVKDASSDSRPMSARLPVNEGPEVPLPSQPAVPSVPSSPMGSRPSMTSVPQVPRASQPVVSSVPAASRVSQPAIASVPAAPRTSQSAIIPAVPRASQPAVASVPAAPRTSQSAIVPAVPRASQPAVASVPAAVSVSQSAVESVPVAASVSQSAVESVPAAIGSADVAAVVSGDDQAKAYEQNGVVLPPELAALYRLCRVDSVQPTGVIGAVVDIAGGTEAFGLKFFNPGSDVERAVFNEGVRRLEALSRENNTFESVLFHFPDSCAFLFPETSRQSLVASIYCNGVLEPAVAAQAALLIAQGMEFAHQHGIVNGNLKPSNIIFEDHSGIVMPVIYDLGQRLYISSVDQISFADIPYIAPELQYNLQNSNAQADIYAFGMCMAYMLLGRTLYASETKEALIAEIQGLSEAPQILSAMPTLDPGFAQVIQWCINFDPSGRYMRFSDVIRDLYVVYQNLLRAV